MLKYVYMVSKVFDSKIIFLVCTLTSSWNAHTHDSLIYVHQWQENQMCTEIINRIMDKRTVVKQYISMLSQSYMATPI